MMAYEHAKNYNSLMQTYEQLAARHAADRDAWTEAEAALRRENAELRAQLMYVLTQMQGGGWRAGSPPPPPTSAALPNLGDSSALGAGAAPPPSESPSTAASDIKAAIERAKASSPFPSPAAPPTPGASPPPTPSLQSQGSGQEAGTPAWAAEVAAAMAAVDEVDILEATPDFSMLAQPPPAAAATSPPQTVAAGSVAAPDASTAPESRAAGPPPVLTLGADDIFWVNQLHSGLAELGYYAAEEDMDDFYFGESTQSALLTMQACEGLAETGTTDMPTWIKLLGPDLIPREVLPEDGTAPQAASPAPSAPPAQKPYAELFSASLTETVTGGTTTSDLRMHDTQLAADGHVIQDDSVTLHQTREVSADGEVHVTSHVASQHVEMEEIPLWSEWPSLMEGDGGREVHVLHVALTEAGYHPGEDDTVWWIFGTETTAAVKTCQACSGLPESGVVNAATWLAILGPDATPAAASTLRSNASDDEDLEFKGDRVWLIGEQRWSDSSKLGKGQ